MVVPSKVVYISRLEVEHQALEPSKSADVVKQVEVGCEKALETQAQIVLLVHGDLEARALLPKSAYQYQQFRM